MSVKEDAAEFHASGYNCAQSVLKACRKYYPDIDENILSAAAAGFGGGVNCGNICGALSGAVMALGLAEGFDDSDVLDSKHKISAQTKICNGIFKDKFGSLLCSELRGGRYSCDELIKFGAETAENIINKRTGE